MVFYHDIRDTDISISVTGEATVTPGSDLNLGINSYIHK